MKQSTTVLAIIAVAIVAGLALYRSANGPVDGGNIPIDGARLNPQTVWEQRTELTGKEIITFGSVEFGWGCTEMACEGNSFCNRCTGSPFLRVDDEHVLALEDANDPNAFVCTGRGGTVGNIDETSVRCGDLTPGTFYELTGMLTRQGDEPFSRYILKVTAD